MISVASIQKIVTPEGVSNDPAVLDAYSKDMSFTQGKQPQYVVYPTTADQITQLVRLAHTHRCPVVCVSSQGPHFGGDTVPEKEHALILDCSRMKKIIRADRDHRTAIVEPGVCFSELEEAVKREGLRLNMPLMPRATKSVVGSMLSRDPVIMPKYHWDIADPLGCVEVVFGNGEVFRTGSAAGPGTLEEQWAMGGSQKEATGPSATAWYRLIQGSQGTMGAVTWASLRCEVSPTREKAFLVAGDNLEQLVQYELMLNRLRLINECLILNRSSLGIMLQCDLSSLPEWILIINTAAYTYFPDFRLDGQIRDIQSQGERLSLLPVEQVGQLEADEVLELARHSCPGTYWKLRPSGGCESICYLARSEKISELFDIAKEEARKVGYPLEQLSLYVQPIVQAVNTHCEINLFYDPENRTQADLVRILSINLTHKLVDAGAYFSRPMGTERAWLMGLNAKSLSALKRVKDVFDPDRIMNPGKLATE